MHYQLESNTCAAEKDGNKFNMKHYTSEWLLVLALIVLLITAFLVAQQRDDLKAEAVKRGAAEWVADYNGITTFKWKEKQ